LKKNLILNFHAVSDGAWFENLLLYLKSAYCVSPLSAFERAANCRQRHALCHLTFDDGDRAFYQTVFPLLCRHSVPATIFVSPRSVVEQFNFWFQEINGYDTAIMQEIFARELNIPIEKIISFDMFSLLKTQPVDLIWNLISLYRQQTGTAPKPCQNINRTELETILASRLISVGAHTLYHPVLPNETDVRAKEEILGSISELETLTGEEVRYFAYPNGRYGFDYGEREMEILRRSNIKLALTTEPHFVNGTANPLRFPRIGITCGNLRTIRTKLWLGPWWERIKYLRRTSEATKKAQIKAILNGRNYFLGTPL